MNDKDKATALTGIQNSRLNNMDLCNNMYTSPEADGQAIMGQAQLTTPQEQDVIHAKDWVDNGSLL